MSAIDERPSKRVAVKDNLRDAKVFLITQKV